MAWIGLWDPEYTHFCPAGLGGRRPTYVPKDAAPETLLTQGSLVIETRLTPGKRPQPLVRFDRYGSWRSHLSLQSIPGGGVTLVVNQGGEIAHGSVGQSANGRLDVLRITYSWNALKGWGRLAMERLENGQVLLSEVARPKPIRLCDLNDLIRASEGSYISPDVQYIAVSTHIEPVGPMPTLTRDIPIATPEGYVPAGALRKGDRVTTATGRTVPVLQTVSREVPARGMFGPVRIRAPYFGLQRNIVVAPSQRLVISGSEVDYMFGTEAVLANACHFVGGTAAVPAKAGPLVTYCQLLLPGHEALIAAGTALESLFIGRMRRDARKLSASLLQGMNRDSLPEHGAPVHPVLRPFDALVLAEQRAA